MFFVHLQLWQRTDGSAISEESSTFRLVDWESLYFQLATGFYIFAGIQEFSLSNNYIQLENLVRISKQSNLNQATFIA